MGPSQPQNTTSAHLLGPTVPVSHTVIIQYWALGTSFHGWATGLSLFPTRSSFFCLVLEFLVWDHGPLMSSPWDKPTQYYKINKENKQWLCKRFAFFPKFVLTFSCWLSTLCGSSSVVMLDKVNLYYSSYKWFGIWTSLNVTDMNFTSDHVAWEARGEKTPTVETSRVVCHSELNWMSLKTTFSSEIWTDLR